MSRIFSDAHEVIIWLSVGNYCKPHIWYMKDSCSCRDRLIDDPYWQRLWIIQEVLLARKRVIWFNTHCLHWKDVLEHFTFKEREIDPGHMFWSLNGRMKEDFPFDLAKMLQDTCQSHCEDPRDIFYGIQSLIRQDQRQTVDYAKSTEQVFAEGAVIALKSEQDSMLPFDLYRIFKRMMPVHLPWRKFNRLFVALEEMVRRYQRDGWGEKKFRDGLESLIQGKLTGLNLWGEYLARHLAMRETLRHRSDPSMRLHSQRPGGLYLHTAQSTDLFTQHLGYRQHGNASGGFSVARSQIRTTQLLADPDQPMYAVIPLRSGTGRILGENNSG